MEQDKLHAKARVDAAAKRQSNVVELQHIEAAIALVKARMQTDGANQVGVLRYKQCAFQTKDFVRFTSLMELPDYKGVGLQRRRKEALATCFLVTRLNLCAWRSM